MMTVLFFDIGMAENPALGIEGLRIILSETEKSDPIERIQVGDDDDKDELVRLTALLAFMATVR